MARIGKIARLPHEVREELNRRLRGGEKARRLLPWLNSLPAVQAVLNAEFAGRGIREQNISEWRKGGYRDWLAQQVALEAGYEICRDVTEMGRGCKCNTPLAVTDKLVAFLKAHYVVAMKHTVRKAAGSSVDLKALQTMCADVMALRKGDQDAEWLNIERRRLALEEEHSIVRFRKKHREELDHLFTFLDHYDPKVRAAWQAYVKELEKRMELPEQEKKESKSLPPGTRATAAEPNPDKSDEIPPDPTNPD